MPTVNELIEASRLHEMDKKAREAGFMSLVSGEVYECQYNISSHIFIMLEGNVWNVWRETWQKGKLQAISCKIIAERVPFAIALQKAKKYGDFIHKSR